MTDSIAESTRGEVIILMLHNLTKERILPLILTDLWFCDSVRGEMVLFTDVEEPSLLYDSLASSAFPVLAEIILFDVGVWRGEFLFPIFSVSVTLLSVNTKRVSLNNLLRIM